LQQKPNPILMFEVNHKDLMTLFGMTRGQGNPWQFGPWERLTQSDYKGYRKRGGKLTYQEWISGQIDTLRHPF
jgi:hypothetical protein